MQLTVNSRTQLVLTQLATDLVRFLNDVLDRVNAALLHQVFISDVFIFVAIQNHFLATFLEYYDKFGVCSIS